MNTITAYAIAIVVCLISVWQVIEIGSENAKIKDEFSQFKRDKEEEIAKINDRRNTENEIQAGLADVLNKLNGLGVSVNANLDKILRRPVYDIQCTDADGVREINRYSGKSPAEIINR